MPEEQVDIEVRVSADKMAVLVDGSFPEDDFEPVKTAILEKLKALAIAEEANQIDLDEWLRNAAASGPSLDGALLYEGQQAVPPKDGQIEWAEDFFTKKFYIDPDSGAIDYRRLATKNTVEEDQLLARAIPPVPGEEGMDVFGKKVKVGKAKPAPIRVGKNVRQEEDDSFYAAITGRIHWSSNTLSVDEVLTVSGDIGLESGNITHPGALVVQHDILKGSQVDVKGDIEVRGVVEACDIRAGGKLVVHGGIAGAEGHRIVVGEGIHARFILDADIEAGESVVVEKEILQSKIRTRGAISVEKGRVVGGEYTALGGFVAQYTGSEANVPTMITVGMDYALAENLEEPERKLAELNENRIKIHKAIAPLLRNLDALPPAKLEAVKKLAKQVKGIESEIAELQQEIDDIRKESVERTKLRAVIQGEVFAETFITIRSDRLHVRETQKGPLQAIPSKNGTRLVSMTAQ